jgi:alginate O-acetyltransferase complex protein AlgJ
VRQIDRPTRAALDYAAYHANFMIAELPPEREPTATGSLDTSKPFRGMVEKSTLTADIKKTPLTEAERARPLAFAPAVEFLQSKRVAGAAALEELGTAVRSESWGLTATAGSPTQSVTEIFLRGGESTGQAGSAGSKSAEPVEVWAKIEFAPWFKALGPLPDQDADGFPEVYGRVQSGLVGAPVVDALEREYAGRTLSPAEVKAWANQLSSYWYPSYNTDLIAPPASWPDDRTEADIKRELGGRVFSAPTIVLRGKPQGKPTYEVFIIKPGECAPGAACGAESTAGAPAKPTSGSGRATAAASAPKIAKTRPTPQPQPLAEALTRELAENGGGSWAKWAAQVAPLHQVIRQRLRAAPARVKAFAGLDGFLFYRNGLEFVTGGDLEKQRKGKNPLPIIVEFKNQLAAHDVDFLFVPVPAKEEIFPDEIDPNSKGLVGHVVDPFSRKLLLSLAQAGVEVVDLLPPFLEARTKTDGSKEEPLYQHQDTHWTDRGLRLAADIIGRRIKQYPWFSELSAHARPFTLKETSFTRYGDLFSRLPDAEKAPYKPETLVAHQVMDARGEPYEDDPDSPIVVLGDSFTGVYELTDAEHAGVSAHIARGAGYPVDLVMSYGGGPNVRQKLMRRGAGALSAKKLVIWIMTARDLYNYWEDWEPLTGK